MMIAKSQTGGKIMSSLLSKLTDEEMETALSYGGRGKYCNLYIGLLPGAIAACAATGNSSACSEMQFYANYIHSYC